MSLVNLGQSEILGQVLVDLIAAFASTNRVKISIGYRLGKRLVESNMLGIEHSTGLVRCSSEESLYNAIVSDSYPRGDYVVRLVSLRICKSIEQINSIGGTCFLHELNSADFEMASAMLLPLYGVGQKFVEDFCLLAGKDKH